MRGPVPMDEVRVLRDRGHDQRCVARTSGCYSSAGEGSVNARPDAGVPFPALIVREGRGCPRGTEVILHPSYSGGVGMVAPPRCAWGLALPVPRLLPAKVLGGTAPPRGSHADPNPHRR